MSQEKDYEDIGIKARQEIYLALSNSLPPLNALELLLLINLCNISFEHYETVFKTSFPYSIEELEETVTQEKMNHAVETLINKLLNHSSISQEAYDTFKMALKIFFQLEDDENNGPVKD